MILPAARRLRSALAACAVVLAAGLAHPPVALAQEGAAAVQDVTLTDVVLPLGSTVVKVPKLTASGTRLSRDDVAAIFRADSAEPWSARLARLDASSITAPVLVTEHAGPGEMRQTATYREVVARDVRAGKIAELTASGVAVGTTGAKAGAGTYGQIRANDVDLAALGRIAAEPGDGKGAIQRIYALLQVSDIAFSDEKGTTVKIGRLEGHDLGARQIPTGWAGSLDILASPMDDAPRRRSSAAAAADLIEAESIGSLELRNLSVSDSASGGPLLAEIERIAYAATGPEAGIVIDNISVAGGSGRGRLRKLTLAGTSLAPTVAALRRIAANPDGRLPPEEARRLASGIGTLTLADLSLDLPPEASASKHGLNEREPKPVARAKAGEPGRPAEKAADPLATPTPAPPKIALRQAVLGFGAGDGGPNSTRLTLSGLDLPAGLVSGMPIIGALPTYGYDALSLDAAADAAWDESAGTVTLREISLSGKDIGSLRLAGLFGGIGPELFSGSAPAETMLMFSGNARSLDLTVENSGLFERFLAAQSKDLSLKPEELRKEYVTASVLGVPVILGNGPAAKGIGAAMGQFVMNPGKLVIRAKSKEPTGIGFVDLGTAPSPAAVLDRLDVDAKAN